MAGFVIRKSLSIQSYYFDKGGRRREGGGEKKTHQLLSVPFAMHHPLRTSNPSTSYLAQLWGELPRQWFLLCDSSRFRVPIRLLPVSPVVG